MKQQRLAAYLNLIQDLLTCPQGEEWIHLKNHEDLVDVQFLQVMEQVATQLARQGDRESAVFLHNWAAKLHHILVKEIQPPPPEENKSDVYLNVIQKLLASPREMAEEILQAHQAPIGPGLVHKMHEVARQLMRQDDVEPAQFLERLAHQLNQQWLREHDFQANLKKVPVQKGPTTASGPSSATPGVTTQPGTSVTSTSASAPTAPSQTPVTDPDLDDPWKSSAEEAAAPISSPSPHPLISPPSPPSSPSSKTSNAMEPDSTQAIAAGLNAMAQALQQLSQTLMAQRSPHPLWYLEVLEQACTANWQLTTEEVEQLIGVKPHCHRDETVYQRGNWRFTKVGKLGGQTAWQVSKDSGHGSKTAFFG
ncbi:MAG: hypothetical protein ACFBSF_16295 [Leptolyngbyaceae cyanobacterium]